MFLKKYFDAQQYQFFDSNRAYNLNIFAVRSNVKESGLFDDYIYVVYRDARLKWRIHQWQCTTDPGTYWLENPQHVDGTAILVPDQYLKTYKIDTHRGTNSTQQALCQRLGKVKVYRDNNLDNCLDYNYDIRNGNFGINIHGAQHRTKVNNKWSAGCIVFSRLDDFKDFMKILHRSSTIYGNVFSFTLFTEDQFNLDA